MSNHEKIKKRGKIWNVGAISALLLLLLRIPLANIIGNEGNGYLAISWELYIFIWMFFGFGLYGTMNDLVKRRVQKNLYHNSTRVLTTGLVIGSILSLLGGIILYILSRFIFTDFYQLKVGNISFQIFSVYLFISTISHCLRGYFEGLGTKMPTGYSKMVEVAVSGSGAIILGRYFFRYGEKVANLLFYPQYKSGFGAAGVVLGLLCGGIFSLLLLIIIYRIYQLPFQELLKKDETRVFESYKNIFKEIMLTLFIYTVPVFFFKIYRIVNMTLFLRSYSAENIINGVRYIGTYYGKIILLLFIFITLIVGFTGNNINKIKKYISMERLNLVRKYYFEDIRRLLIVSIPITVIIGIGAEYILGFLYGSNQQYEIIMLQTGTVNILIITLATYGHLLLSSLNKNIQIFIIFSCSFAIQTIGMLFILKTSMASYSLILGEIIFWLSALILEGIYLFKIINFSFTVNK